MIGYIYETTNNINNMKYIGKRVEACFDDKYFGSGTYLNNAINKYGKENFSVKIIDTAESKEELCEKEIYWINKFNAVKSDEYYNLKNGGVGGCSVLGYSEEDLNKYKEQTRQKTSERWKDINYKKKVSDGMKQAYKNDASLYEKVAGFKGRNHTDESKQKMSQNRIGNKVLNNGKINIRVKMSEVYKYLENGWELGFHPNTYKKKGDEE